MPRDLTNFQTMKPVSIASIGIAVAAVAFGVFWIAKPKPKPHDPHDQPPSGPQTVVNNTTTTKWPGINITMPGFRKIGRMLWVVVFVAVADAVLEGHTTETANSMIVTVSSRQILELATAERTLDHTYTWQHTWNGSTKEITLKGEFCAKAGFDLADTSTLRLSKEDKEVILHVVYPPPKLLSCELIRQEVVKDENGWWNKLSKQDRENAGNELLRRARTEPTLSHLLDEAETSFRDRLRKQTNLKFGKDLSGIKVRFERATIP